MPRLARYLQLSAPIGHTRGWYRARDSSVKAELAQTTRWPPELQPYTRSTYPYPPPPLCANTILPVSLSYSRRCLSASKPTSRDASLPYGRKGCFAGARTSSILFECLAVWNIGRPDLESVFGPSLSVHAIVKNNEYPRSAIDRFFFTSSFSLLFFFFFSLRFFPSLFLLFFSLSFLFLPPLLLWASIERLSRWECPSEGEMTIGWHLIGRCFHEILLLVTNFGYACEFSE